MAFLHEQIILPLSDLLRGEQVYKHMNFLREAENWTPEQMAAFQQERLRKLLVYAAREVPFYRDWFHHNGLDPANVRLHQMPIVDKAIMRTEGITRFAAENFSPKERIASSSSGSTGEPFRYYTTKTSESINAAAKILTWYNAGYCLGDRYVKIAYQPRSLIKKWQDALNNCTYLQFVSPKASDMNDLLKQVKYASPTIIRAHANVAFYLAQAQKRLQLPISPRVVMTTATNLTPIFRKTIQEAFSCDVIDSYSCEGTACVHETPHHDGYHICHPYGIIETLDNIGQQVRDGMARVISTDLWNLAHPFIRYDTHDIVEMKAGRIIRIVGRDNEQFTALNGRIFTGYAIGDYFSIDQKGIDSYQIICHPDKTLEIRIIPGRDFHDQQIKEIEEHWRCATGQNVRVEISQELIVSANSKQKTIIQENSNI